MSNTHRDLVPGLVYTISIDDCCVQGELRGRFLGWDFGDEPPDGADALFDIGRLGPAWGNGWRTALIKEESNER